jgi:ribonuclease P protein component
MASAHAWPPAQAALYLMRVVPKVASVWPYKAGSTTLPETPSGVRPEDFGRHRRILKTDEFSSVFRLRPVKRTEHFALYQQSNALGHARLGVVVAKRLAQRAVTRNMIKRIAREIFRRSDSTSTDCIIRLTNPLMSRKQSASSKSCKIALTAELKTLLSSVDSQTRHPV